MDKIEVLPENEKNYDISFKIIIVGDAGTGKTCLTTKAIKNIFEESYSATVGFEFFTFHCKINDKIIVLQIWDTCGQEIYKSLVSSFYRNSSLAIIVFSIDSQESFSHVQNWLQEIRRQNESPDTRFFLVGNKIDLENQREVSKEAIENFIKENNFDLYIEASAKTGENVKNIFIEAAKLLYEDHYKNKEKKEEKEKENDGEEEEEEEEEKECVENKNEELKKEKCSFNEHKEKDAIIYCKDCKIYLCNKCEKYHSGLFQNHRLYNLLENKNDEIFTGICKKKNHSKLEYYCKTHNILCCAACIASIKGKGYGKHNQCEVCFIKKIKNEKKKLLEENIKYLEKISSSLEKSINELKIIFDKISKNKEELKINIQKIFTNIRNVLNNKEDELLLNIDKQFDKIFFDEKLIKESKTIPNKIKIYIEKGKIIDKEWNDKDKLSSVINDCINIEKQVNEINIINDNLEKCNSKINIKAKLKSEEEEINTILESIKKLEICYNEVNEDDQKDLGKEEKKGDEKK